MEEQTTIINFRVSFMKDDFDFQVPCNTLLTELYTQIYDITGVPPHSQKLIFKGSLIKSLGSGDHTLSSAGIVEGTKIMLMGTKKQELDDLKNLEERVERGKRYVTTVTPYKSKAPIRSFSDKDQPRFLSIKELAGWPKSDQARNILIKLASDPCIVGVMKERRWQIGCLSELSPLEVRLLGLNKNKTEEILLRLRYEDGFRSYSSIRDVLFHELTHVVFGDHDEKFRDLMNQLIKESKKYEDRGRKLVEGESYYEPVQHEHIDENEIDDGGVGYRLGGDESESPTLGSTPSSHVTAKERAAQAAIEREKNNSKKS